MHAAHNNTRKKKKKYIKTNLRDMSYGKIQLHLRKSSLRQYRKKNQQNIYIEIKYRYAKKLHNY